MKSRSPIAGRHGGLEGWSNTNEGPESAIRDHIRLAWSLHLPCTVIEYSTPQACTHVVGVSPVVAAREAEFNIYVPIDGRKRREEDYGLGIL